MAPFAWRSPSACMATVWLFSCVVAALPTEAFARTAAAGDPGAPAPGGDDVAEDDAATDSEATAQASDDDAAPGPAGPAGDAPEPGGAVDFDDEAVVAAPLAADTTPTDGLPKVRKSKGKPRLASTGDRAVRVGGMVQVRFAVGPPWRGAGDPDGDDGPLAGEWQSSFVVQRARFEAGVNLARWKLRTKFDFGRGNARLLNAYGARELGGGLAVQVGQFKRIFSRTFLISAEEMQLFERPDVAEAAGGKRDIGALLSGAWLDDRVEAGLGVFNGNGANTQENDNPNLRAEARVDIAPLGRYDLRSYPIGSKAKVRLGAGATLYRDNSPLDNGKIPKIVLTEFDETLAWSAFAAVRVARVELRAEGYLGDRDPIDARPETERSTPLPVEGQAWRGGYLQLAADVPFAPGLQLVGVVEQWEPNEEIREDSETRWTAAANLYFIGDSAKIQGAWQHRTLRLAGSDASTRTTAYVQLQLAY